VGVSRFDLHDFFVVGSQILQFNSVVFLPVREPMAFSFAPFAEALKRKANVQPAKRRRTFTVAVRN
jgi:hypothetical protein